MKIIEFEPEYRDDLIFMILNAKNALGRMPRINEDLLDIKKHYFDKGDKFWIVVDDNNRVIGSVGCNAIEGTSEIWLRRLFVKPELKHKGIGTWLLLTVEQYAKIKGVTVIHVHLGAPKEQWFESYNFYPKHGYVIESVNPCLMKKEI